MSIIINPGSGPVGGGGATMSATPWTTAGLQQQAERPGANWDARLAATLLALSDRIAALEVGRLRGDAAIAGLATREQIGAIMASNHGSDGVYARLATLEADSRAHDAEHRELATGRFPATGAHGDCLRCGTPLTCVEARDGHVCPAAEADKLHASAPERPHWVTLQCYECALPGQECSSCGDAYCLPHARAHERACWFDDAGRRLP